jgi:hypothetical protein
MRNSREDIREKGYDYPLKAELGVKWIPQKTYATYFPLRQL